jgi:hypothetical protein
VLAADGVRAVVVTPAATVYRLCGTQIGKFGRPVAVSAPTRSGHHHHVTLRPTTIVFFGLIVLSFQLHFTLLLHPLNSFFVFKILKFLGS